MHLASVFALALMLAPLSAQAQNMAEAQAAHDAKDYDRAVPMLEALVKSQTPEANMLLGAMYRDGRGVKRDGAKAMSLFRKAAQQNHLPGIRLIAAANTYRSNSGEKAGAPFETLQRLAREGDAESAKILASFYKIGLAGFPKDAAKTRYWQELATKFSDTPAEHRKLGLAYAKGTGAKRDMPAAARHFLKAAQAGDGIGQYNIGLLHETGEGVRLDIMQAINWYRKADAQNVAAATRQLGRLHLVGNGVARDPKRGVDMLQDAVKRGDKNAMFTLATLYERGIVVSQDPDRAMALYQSAANGSNASADAQYTFGLALYTGTRIEQSVSRGVSYVRFAARQGHPDATKALPAMAAKNRQIKARAKNAKGIEFLGSLMALGAALAAATPVAPATDRSWEEHYARQKRIQRDMDMSMATVGASLLLLP